MGKLTGCEDDYIHAWFDHLKDSFLLEKVQLKTFSMPVKTSCPRTENPELYPVLYK